MQQVADEIRKGNKQGFVNALLAPFSASLKQRFALSKDFSLVPELGAEFSTTPVAVRLGGEFAYPMNKGLKLKGTIKIGFNVGLSKKGWAWVAQKIGGEAIKRFAASAGRSLSGLWEALLAEGIVTGVAVVAGAVVGAFAMTYLMAWVLADASRKGVLKGMATWYVGGYTAKVGGYRVAEGSVGREHEKTKNDLIRLGEQDAVADARRVLRKVGLTQANGTDDEALVAYRNILIKEYGNWDAAKARTKESLERKSRKLVGL
jgi:hypothetical protein